MSGYVWLAAARAAMAHGKDCAAKGLLEEESVRVCARARTLACVDMAVMASGKQVMTIDECNALIKYGQGWD